MNIEEEFFKAFGIEPIANKYECRCGTNTTKQNINTCKSDICDKKYCDQAQVGVYYPEITDRKLLELICILNSINGVNCTAYESKNANDLKIEILRECLQIKDDNELKVKVRKLFEDKEQ